MLAAAAVAGLGSAAAAASGAANGANASAGRKLVDGECHAAERITR